MTKPTIGFIGLGDIGEAMAGRLFAPAAARATVVACRNWRKCRMTSLKIFLASLSLVLAADAVPENIQQTNPWLFSILLGECSGILSSDRILFLEHGRNLGQIPPFEPGWCVKQGIVPEGMLTKKGSET